MGLCLNTLKLNLNKNNDSFEDEDISLLDYIYEIPTVDYFSNQKSAYYRPSSRTHCKYTNLEIW